MTAQPTLAAFLLARIAEDAAAAQALDSIGYYPESDQWPNIQQVTARALAGCERDRRIIELHKPDPILEFCLTCFSGDFDHLNEPEHEPSPCPTLRALALPHADHPDYREEWRP